jgi:hypothetical protein
MDRATKRTMARAEITIRIGPAVAPDEARSQIKFHPHRKTQIPARLTQSRQAAKDA